jgi:hypothetical protein
MNKITFILSAILVALIFACGGQPPDPRLTTHEEEIAKLRELNDRAKEEQKKLQEANDQTKEEQKKLQEANDQTKEEQKKLQEANDQTKEELTKLQKENKQLNTLAKSNPLIRQPVEEKDFDALLTQSTASVKNQPKNIIFVFIDSLRNDLVNAATAPNMKKFIDDNWGFEHPYSSSSITHKSTFSMFYSQPALLRQPFIGMDWKKGSPFLRSMQKFGYNIKLYGSPWQYCRDNVAQKENSTSRTSGVSNLRLLYGEKPKNLLSQCYKFHDFDDTQYIVNNRRNPEDYPQEFPHIGILADSWEKYVGDFVANKNFGQKYKYQHQGYLDYKIVSDAMNEIQNDNLPGNTSKNFYFVYLFGVHSSQAWPDRGIPDNILAPTSFSITPEFAPFQARLRHVPTIANGDFGATLPSLHTPLYWEIGSLLNDALRPNWAVSDAKYSNLRKELIDIYHNSVVGADYEFYRLMNSLTPQQQDESLIVLVSDHGYILFDKGPHPITGEDLSTRYNHFAPLVKENTQVPIAIKFPKSTDPKLAAPNKKNIGSHVDIFPTVVDYISPDFYSELKDKNLVVGSSILSHDRTCATTVYPTGTFVDTSMIFNNGSFKAWIDLDATYQGAPAGFLDTKNYVVRAFLDMEDNIITYPAAGGFYANSNSAATNASIIAREFSECLEEVFPKTDLVAAGKEQAKYDVRLRLNDVIKELQSKSFAQKMDFLQIFKGEDVNYYIYSYYATLSPTERATMLGYVGSLQFTLGNPALNPTNDPIADFALVPPTDIPNLASCVSAELPGKSSDPDQNGDRPGIFSANKNILIKPDEQNFYYNDYYFENHNYTNLPRLYFDKLKKTERFHGFAFVGNRGGKTPQEAQDAHIRTLKTGLYAGQGNNIDVFRYFQGAEGGTLGGFRSFSRSTLIAKNFAGKYQKGNDPTVTEGGYVYAVYIEGGLNILGVDNPWPSNDPNKPINSYAHEQEVVVRGNTPPKNIVAFRKMHMGSNKFDNTQQLYVRNGFKTMDPAAYQRVVNALSGCSRY